MKAKRNQGAGQGSGRFSGWHKAMQGKCQGWTQGRGEQGLTLIEIAIVVAILGILVGIVTVAVTGSGNTARATSKATDIREVQKAVNGYRGMQPQEKWPTLEKQVGSARIQAGTVPTLPFSAANPLTFVAIDWQATFTTPLDGTKRLVPSFLPKVPKHALDTTLDADGNGTPDQSDPTQVWILETGGVVNVLLRDADY